MATELEATLVLDAGAALGEGPLWDVAEGVLWWVDIDGRRVHRFDPASGSDRSFEAPGQPGAVALMAESDRLLVALPDGVWTFSPPSGEWAMFVPIEEPPDVRSNDGKPDPAGRFVIGTMADDERPEGGLYSVEADGSLRRLLDGLSISNGLAWTADGATFFYIDSPTRRVDVFDYDVATGSIDRRRPWLEFDDAVAVPDGMAIDAEDGLWVAFWDGWSVRRYDPSGRLDIVVSVGAAQVTSCAFGGPDLRDLYITTAATGLTDAARASQPAAGGLFHVRTPVAGVPAHRFGRTGSTG